MFFKNVAPRYDYFCDVVTFTNTQYHMHESHRSETTICELHKKLLRMGIEPVTCSATVYVFCATHFSEVRLLVSSLPIKYFRHWNQTRNSMLESHTATGPVSQCD